MMEGLLKDPIYLHFLDRELRNSVQANLDDSHVLDLIDVGILLTSQTIYLNNSLLWENLSTFPLGVHYLLELEKLKEVLLLSNHITLDEFVSSRRHLYERDKLRYPMYFGDEIDNKPWGKNLLIMSDSTTELLETNLKKLITSKNLMEFGYFPQQLGLNQSVLSTVKQAIENRSEQAITFSLFSGYLPESDDKLEKQWTIRRLVSLLYTKRYLEFLQGTVLTGIPNVHFFDSLCDKPLFYDFMIHRFLFNRLGLLSSSEPDINKRLLNIITIKKHVLFIELLTEIRALIEGIYENSIDANGPPSRRLIFDNLQKALDHKTFSQQLTDKVSSAYSYLLSLNKQMSKDTKYKEGYEKMKKLSTRKKIVLITATLTELKILMSVLDEKSISIGRFTNGTHTYFNFELGGNDVYAFKSNMGSVSPGGSIISISEAMNAINPDYLIMVGIAFGLKQEKQSIGDILVSRQLWSYEPAKITNGVEISRGDKVTASTLLLDRFGVSSLNWGKTKVEFGLIVSGEKLVDSKQFVEKLLRSQPEAIGGEMEGTGLMSVCQHVKKDWILVKAICDWGYEKTGDYQELAACNAVEYVLQTISDYIN